MSKTLEKQPQVSVVIPAYNASAHLTKTVKSVLAQAFRDFEVIVVDDGSTDDTAQVASAFEDQIMYIYKKNEGSASARNRGISAARGTYVAFLDADDRWKRLKLERQMARFERDPKLAWCYSDSFLVDADSGEIRFRKSQIRDRPEGDIFEALLLGNFVAPSTTIVRRDIFDEVGYFNESDLHRISEDWDLWLRIAEKYPIGYVAEPLVITSHHADRKTETMNLEKALHSRGTIIQRALERRPDVPDTVRQAAWANLHVSMGRKWLNRSDRSRSRDHFIKALSYKPVHLDAWLFLVSAYLPRSVLNVLGTLRQWVRTQRHNSDTS